MYYLISYNTTHDKNEQILCSAGKLQSLEQRKPLELPTTYIVFTHEDIGFPDRNRALVSEVRADNQQLLKRKTQAENITIWMGMQ